MKLSCTSSDRGKGLRITSIIESGCSMAEPGMGLREATSVKCRLAPP